MSHHGIEQNLRILHLGDAVEVYAHLRSSALIQFSKKQYRYQFTGNPGLTVSP